MMMASMVANGNREGQALVLKGVDPETCMIVFKNHWAQVVKILEKHDPLRTTNHLVASLGNIGLPGGHTRFSGPIPGDEASAVQNYVEHMLFLLMEEDAGQVGAMGPILEFVVMENVMERLFVWSLRKQFTDDMKLEQLKMYEMIVSQARQPLLHHKPVLRPLMMLLSSCSGTPAPAVETELVLLLNQLCCVLAKDPSVLELFFHTSEDQGAANFLIFSLLIPFIHREGQVGQQARDALLLIMSLSGENQRVAKHIEENTYFCPVLATGLSGLYSSLPTKLDVACEEWHCLHREDWVQVPALVQFLNSLEFCNAVIQVSHPSIRKQLVDYIYNGFLVPVLAPALHKLTVEEVMTTTAYLDLFLRSVSEPALLQTFLSFILLHQHENVHILDTLVSRVNTPFQLGTVSLALFRTLIGLYCEDVMLQLILRYLIPCNHMMLSQRRVGKERDCYSVSAAKILALTPSCCSPEHIPPPLRQMDSILWSKVIGGSANTGLMETDESFLDDGSGHTCVIGSEVHLDVSYLHYLYDARLGISSCIRACRVWSAPYDGEHPPPDEYQASALEEAGAVRGRHTQMVIPKRAHPHPRPRPACQAAAPANQLELEWDDSYDAGPLENAEAAAIEGPVQPLAPEPPKHIQDLRRTATMLVQGSYIEESDFQDDVMVYNLVARKDSRDTVDGCRPSRDTALKRSETQAETSVEDSRFLDSSLDVKEVPLNNGLSPPLRLATVEDGSDTKRSKDVSGHIADHNSTTLQSPDVADMGNDLVAQYEELIRTLGGGAGTGREPFQNPMVTPMEEEEIEEMDLPSFSVDTPELDKHSSSLFGTKPRAGSARSQPLPFTGPFVSVLLSRLENMLENPVHVNLLVTGILAQLAAYPQPLLQSFLLNTNMVFQPSVRSLYQVLASLKNQIEELASTRKDFPELITSAQHCLLARESSLRGHDTEGGDDRECSPREAQRRMKSSPLPQLKPISMARTEVFATVLFAEFLKELAAIAQEHSILSHVPMEE